MADGKVELSAELTVDKSSLKSLEKDLQYTQKILDKMKEKPIELLSDKEIEKMNKLVNIIHDLEDQINDIKSGETLSQYLGFTDEEGRGGMFSSLIQLVSGGALKMIKSSFSSLQGITKKVAGGFKNMFTNLVKGASKGAMSMKRMMMAMVGARSLFTIISKATHQYMARNEELNTKLQTMWATLGQLIGPVVEYIVNLILKLMGYFLSFIKLLGVNTDALKKQAKASQASAKAQERQLAAFDEMNKLSDNGGDGAGSYDLPEFNIGDSLDGLGKNIAEKINDLLDDIDWEKIQHKVRDIVSTIVANINDFIATLNWKLLGWNIAQGINTAIVAVYTFITQFDWMGFATKMGELFATIFSNIDWGRLAVILILGTVNLLTAWFTFVGTFLSTINWQRVVDYIRAGLAEIDWLTVLGGLGAAFLKALVEILTLQFITLPSLLIELIAGIFKGMGADGIAGFLQGISDRMRNIGTWLRQNVFDPFINWFKSLFGIHSPSTVMASLGVDIMLGLFNGITSMVSNVKRIWEDLKLNIVSVWNNIKDWVVNTVATIKDAVVERFTTAKNTALSVWTDFKTKVGEIFDGIWNKIKNVINSILGGVEKMANGVISGINTVIRALNNLSFRIPDWVPLLGGSSFGFNISQLGSVSIPRLAQGAVIPPNREFMAVLGDQKHGTNIEAPLDTIVEAFKQVQGDNSGVIQVVLKLDSKVLAKQLVDTKNKLDFSFNR